jgi:ribosomal protein L11 methyltransferase
MIWPEERWIMAEKELANSRNRRVVIRIGKGLEQLFPEDVYTLAGGGLWIEEKGEDRLVIAFPSDTNAFLRALRRAKIGIKEISIEDEEPLDYVSLTKTFFKPIRVEGVTIVPPWERRAGVEPRIIIEPGMAFGTGWHESTAIMLRLIQTLDLEGKTVIDLGCGSAILGIYAHLKGARRVFAIDNDIDAVMSARRNIRLNNTRRVRLACADLADLEGSFDVVLGNLDIGLFRKVASAVAGFVKPRGHLVMSGILGKDRKEALKLFQDFTVRQAEHKNAWWGFVVEAP